MLPREVDWQQTATFILALLIAIPVHEFAHALSAVNNGDDGPRRANRLSILPWDHFDPFGAFFCVVTAISGFGLGWGKPVMVNPGMLNNPRWDMCKIAAWGPFSNFLLAVAFAMPLRFMWVDGQGAQILFIFVIVNLSLMLFNLIPVGPLDGAKIVVAFLPDRLAHDFSRFMQQWGMLMLLGLVLMGGPVLRLLVSVPAGQLVGLLLGTAW